MRLTNFIRETFVRAVMADVPEVDYDKKMNELSVKACFEALPPSIRAIAEDENLSQWLNREYVYMLSSDSNSISAFVPRNRSSRYYISGVNPVISAEIEKLSVLKKKQRDDRCDLKNKLTGCANAASTRKRLVDMLPEFEKYLPVDNTQAAKSFPLVTNVVSDFVKAGWPKGVAK